MDQNAKLRAFLALPLAPLFQNEVAPLLEEVKIKWNGARWVASTEIHATLHFFGSIEADEVVQISDSVAPVCRFTKPIQIFLEKVGAFPDRRRPRVIWIGMGGDVEALVNLYGSLEERLQAAGFPCEGRPFKAHVTIGRIKEVRETRDFPQIDFGPTEPKILRELVLFQSHLGPQGAHYEAIATYPFSSP